MVQDFDETLVAICRIPRQYRRRGDVSIVDLLRHSGYVERRASIDEHAIAAYLHEHPELVDEWQHYSEDKRCTPSWFLSRTGSDAETSLTVGYVQKNGAVQVERRFSDRFLAAAAFIKQEVDFASTRRMKGVGRANRRERPDEDRELRAQVPHAAISCPMIRAKWKTTVGACHDASQPIIAARAGVSEPSVQFRRSTRFVATDAVQPSLTIGIRTRAREADPRWSS